MIVITVQAFLKERKSSPCPERVYSSPLAICERKALLQKLLCKPLPVPLYADNTLWSPISAAWTTEYTELQPLLSGVLSVMRVKLVLAGEGGGCTPTPSHDIYPHQ
jgi:hypothetical protein